MKPLAAFRLLAATLFHRSHVEAEMDEELRSHVEVVPTISSVPVCPAPKPSAERASSSAAMKDSKRNAAKK
jgi:hypothetical protein